MGGGERWPLPDAIRLTVRSRLSSPLSPPPFRRLCTKYSHPCIAKEVIYPIYDLDRFTKLYQKII